MAFVPPRDVHIPCPVQKRPEQHTRCTLQAPPRLEHATQTEPDSWEHVVLGQQHPSQPMQGAPRGLQSMGAGATSHSQVQSFTQLIVMGSTLPKQDCPADRDNTLRIRTQRDAQMARPISITRSVDDRVSKKKVKKKKKKKRTKGLHIMMTD